MRFLLLALMFALLPLCGWASSGVPAGHHSIQIIATKNSAAHAMPVALRAQFGLNNAALHRDCNEHVHAKPAVMASVTEQAPLDLPSLTENPISDKPCSSCGDCSLCHSLALMSAPRMAVPSPRPYWLRPSQSARFASALSALRLKPPIA